MCVALFSWKDGRIGRMTGATTDMCCGGRIKDHHRTSKVDSVAQAHSHADWQLCLNTIYQIAETITSPGFTIFISASIGNGIRWKRFAWMLKSDSIAWLHFLSPVMTPFTTGDRVAAFYPLRSPPSFKCPTFLWKVFLSDLSVSWGTSPPLC